MFAVESPVIAFYARFSGLTRRPTIRTQHPMDHQASAPDPQRAILGALAEMLPSTSEEIAETAGLDPVTAAASLDALTARYRVMFNPLTKRYSLPKTAPATGIAA